MAAIAQHTIDILAAGGSITKIWEGSATNGTTVNWSGTGYSWTDFDLVLIVIYCNNPTSLTGYSSQLLPGSTIPSTVAFNGVVEGGGAGGTTIYRLSSITQTSMYVGLSSYNSWSGYLNKIYGIKLS